MPDTPKDGLDLTRLEAMMKQVLAYRPAPKPKKRKKTTTPPTVAKRSPREPGKKTA